MSRGPHRDNAIFHSAYSLKTSTITLEPFSFATTTKSKTGVLLTGIFRRPFNPYENGQLKTGGHLFRFDRSDNREFTRFRSTNYHKFTRNRIDICQSCYVDLMCHQNKRLGKGLILKPL